MRIVCPACNATYEVADQLLKPGRAVRCVRCSEEWQPLPLAPPIEETPPPSPERVIAEPLPPEPVFPRSAPTISPPMRPPVAGRHGNASLRAAWVASIVVLLLFGWGAYTWRDTVMRDWPPSTRLYSALGLAPQPR